MNSSSSFFSLSSLLTSRQETVEKVAGLGKSKGSDHWSSVESDIWFLILSVFQVLTYIGPCQRSLQDQWLSLFVLYTFLKWTEKCFPNTTLGNEHFGKVSKAQKHIYATLGIIPLLLQLSESNWNSKAASDLTTFITQPFLHAVAFYPKLLRALGSSLHT